MKLTQSKAKILQISIATFVVAAGGAQASVLAHYGFNTNGDTSADSVATGITATAASIADGATSSGLFPIEGARSIYNFNSNITNTETPTVSEIEATFSLTPDAGQTITLDASNSVTWSFRSYDADVGAMNTYTRMYIASDAGFTNILAVSSVFEALHDATATSGDARWGPVVSANLDQSVSSSSTLYFGLAAGDNSTFGDKQLRYDDFTVNGSVIAIPEPSAALLGAFAVIGLMRRRRF